MNIDLTRNGQPIAEFESQVAIPNASTPQLIHLPPELEMSFDAFQRHKRLDLPAARQAYHSLFSGHDPQTLLPVARTLHDGDATKLIFTVGRRGRQAGAAENLEVESVILPMKNFHGRSWITLCISSQVGCRMGCVFCQTGRMGLIGQLSARHIISQVISARYWLTENRPGMVIKNIVFMGMGEPLDNTDAVLAAIRRLTEPRGLSFAPGRITLSTVGRIDGLRRLATEQLPPIRLAISITSPRDDLRSELMPINRAMPLSQLKQALLSLPRTARTRFLIQYVMLKDINDGPLDAKALAEWCRDLPVTVNLIPYNPQDQPLFEPSPEDRITRFMAVLKARGILAKRRATICQSQMGACGQLGNPGLRR